MAADWHEYDVFGDLEAEVVQMDGRRPPKPAEGDSDPDLPYDWQPKVEPPYVLPFIDWHDAFSHATGDRAAIDGMLFYGRWTQIVAPAKQGKSDFTVVAAWYLSQGRDPLGDSIPGAGAPVIYLDSENGRLDIVERLEKAGATPDQLSRLHYSDQPEPLNVVEGAARLLKAVEATGALTLIIDGINGFVRGEENKPEPWRELYTFAIAPLKALGVAVLSNDNMGKDKTLGSRGSSAKVDKADCVFELVRTDGGIQLKRTHSRTSAASETIDLRYHGADGVEALRYSPIRSSWPAGTKDAAALLDDLGVPHDATNRAARLALKGAGRTLGNVALAAALRWRKSIDNPENLHIENHSHDGTHLEHTYPQGLERSTERVEQDDDRIL